MPRFRKRPLIVDAVRLTRHVSVQTLEGTVDGEPGDWLITGIEGEQYPVKHSIFMATYEPTNEEAQMYLITNGD